MKLALENAPNDRIPKFIHFIWAGGIKLMDDEREVETVVGWCKANPHCRVHLWVDYDTYPKTARPLLDRYKQIFGAHEIKVVTDVGDNENKVSSLIIRDISEIEDYRGLLALAKSEIKQLYPNFGCSSDIIRLLILRKGGCYFDQDVRCNPCLSLEESGLFERHGLPLIVLEHRPQRATPDAPMKFESAGSVVIHGERDSSSSPDSKASLTVKAASSSEEAAEGSQSPSHNLTPKSESSSDNSYKRFLKLTFDELGNDAIICTPNHPMIIRQLDRIYDNYHLKVSQSALRTAECYGERDRRNRSIIRTGPDVTQTVFREQIRPYIQELDSGGLKLYYLHDEDHVIEFDSESDDDLRHEKLVGAFEFQTMRSRLRELTIPDNNYQNWLRVPIQNISDIGACHKTIIERIKFEIKHFKILRLDDHFDAMIRSMGISENPDAIISNKRLLLQEISCLKLQKLLLTQVTFQHPETIQFCDENHLRTIVHLNRFDFRIAMLNTINMYELDILLKNIQSKQLSQGATVQEYISELKEDDIVSIMNQIAFSISRMEELFLNVDRLPLESQEVLCEFIQDHLELLEFTQQVFITMYEELRKPENKEKFDHLMKSLDRSAKIATSQREKLGHVEKERSVYNNHSDKREEHDAPPPSNWRKG